MAMRASRSHESLSPGQSKTSFDLESDFAARLRMANNLSLANGGGGTTAADDLLDTLLRLNLTSTPTVTTTTSSQTPSAKQADLAHKILTAKRIAQPTTPLVHHIHPSLFNEESCFEIRSLANAVTVVSPSSAVDDQSPTHNLPHISLHNDDYDESAVVTFDQSVTKNGNEDESGRVPREKLNSTSSNLSGGGGGGGKLLKYQSGVENYSTRFFMCRGSEERDRWLQCVRNVMQPCLAQRRHEENALQVWILEAKGAALSNKTSKRYLCEVYLNGLLYAKTSLKDKRDILFWGENFDFM
jgi:hypothetical protein